MELVDKLLGITRRKQEKILGSLGVYGELKKEPFGPRHEDSLIAAVNNEKFLDILKKEKIKKVVALSRYTSDTSSYNELYIDIGEGVKIKTGVGTQDYSEERNLLTELFKMGFRYKPYEEPKGIKTENLGLGAWGVYIVEEPFLTI